MKKILLFLVVILAVIIFFHYLKSAFSLAERASYQGERFWKYQCIDTMKTSRDEARSLPKQGDTEKVITKELDAIQDLGANCVVVGTPYDEEFVPFLTLWVEAAHKRGLSVWFRGNFSGWEGWYGYPKNMTPQEHIAQTEKFILNHANLFFDGDAFDPCPECEGGGPWSVPFDNTQYLKFKQEEVRSMDEAFGKIQKKVITNRLSTIGGRARDVYDAGTVKSLRGVVTIDHYVKDTIGMESYIRYFRDKFKARTFIGEFGAPIPDINGDMSESDQADFIGSVFDVFYRNRADIEGINYWVLTGGTTSLLYPDGSYRKAAFVVKSYYEPINLSFTITDSLGEKINGAQIDIGNGRDVVYSDENGNAESLLPAKEYPVVIKKQNFKPVTLMISGSKKTEITLEPEKADFFYNLRMFFKTSKLLSIFNHS